MLEIVSDKDERFLLFAFLDSSGSLGERFLASTNDVVLLERFSADMQKSFAPTGSIEIDMADGSDMYISCKTTERLILTPGLQDDIETQVFTFFERRDLYAGLRVPYRRGLLFAGPPGCGKTMMLRRLVRECHRRFHAKSFSVRIRRRVDDDTIGLMFCRAAIRSPSLVILDDMDSLTKESEVTRAGLLAQLDGISSPEGMLVIGTTNNPGDIDPALLHRPSRFDRVWHFNLPDATMRAEYLGRAMDNLDAKLGKELVRETDGWSFAYLNELRTTAAILAIQNGRHESDGTCARKALHLLSAQFKAGRKGHVVSAPEVPIGFGEAQGCCQDTKRSNVDAAAVVC